MPEPGRKVGFFVYSVAESCFFEVDVFELGSMAEQIGVFIHDVKLPAQQADRTDGLEVERAIRIPLQHAPEPASTSGQLTVFDAHPLLIIASVGARGLRLVSGGEHFDGLAQVSVADPFGCGIPFLVDDFGGVLAECPFESEQTFGDGFGARVDRRQWRGECFLTHGFLFPGWDDFRPIPRCCAKASG